MDVAADVVILGGSISALMAACHLKQRLPELEVIVLGPHPESEKRPIVGESLVEPAILFFRRLGLGDYLDQEHALKNGLSFYHKLAPDDAGDRRYSVHAPEQLHHLARQLHRPRFDIELRNHAAWLGVQFLEGKAENIEVSRGGNKHRIHARLNRRCVTLRSPFVIDATGRQRFLGKRVTSYCRPQKQQRSVFWFRLADFKRTFLEHIQVTQRRPLQYDLWDTTHHFMGHGNWVWGIPLHCPKHERLISIGITYRPDLFSHSMHSLEDFLAFMDTEHPAIADMVRSGDVLDTHVYRNYLYWAREVYSADGWFLIGDAARAVDPLYSTGMSMTVVQVEQIGEMIARQQAGGIEADQIASLQQVWMSIARQRQEDISDQYASMHDPFQACMRRYWNVTAWFNALLPIWFNGMLNDPETARFLSRLFERGRPATRSAWKLFGRTSNILGPEIDQHTFDQAVDFDWLLNARFDCKPDEVPDQFERLFHKRAVFRWRLAKLTRLRSLPGQLPFIALELLLSRIMSRWLRLAVPSAFQQCVNRSTDHSSSTDLRKRAASSCHLFHRIDNGSEDSSPRKVGSQERQTHLL